MSEDTSLLGEIPPPLTADEVLTGRKRRRNIALTDSEKHAISFQKKERPVRPFVKFNDLNNQNERDILDCNPERNSIVVGIQVSF